ncbi:hypothetical protein PAPYR_6872 [Paratrimastix pyriformis]|uniref:Uncharacterized protein n=1 Tax=Paratrimastix pyriformis TaxID=342808 RepID=A0ABQ8UIT4_9EUKA|nr:hypothetical protein PAPYR_6872 [Paratrimastix pyriformis]
MTRRKRIRAKIAERVRPHQENDAPAGSAAYSAGQWGPAILAEEERLGWAATAERVALATNGTRPARNGVQRRRGQPPSDDDDDELAVLFLRLPTELLLTVVEASSAPLRTYLSLMSLSHAIRMAIRGAPQELFFGAIPDRYRIEFFVDVESIPILTADALAAIVGPCKGLVKLTLPKSLVGCGLTPAACAPWVEEAFAGHSRLAVLHIPWAGPLLAAIVPLLRNLPGLMELHCRNGVPCTGFLETLGRFCPKLQRLAITTRSRPKLDFSGLKPVAGTLKELSLSSSSMINQTLEGLLVNLTTLERFEVSAEKSLSFASLRPIATRLTHLDIATPFPGFDQVTAGLFCRLESLTANDYSPDNDADPVIARMLTTSRATLRSVSLFSYGSEHTYRGILTALSGLSRLSCLSLDLCPLDGGIEAILAALPLGMFAQLEHLELSGFCEKPISITSSSLRTLALDCAALLTLTCPALEELNLKGSQDDHFPVILDCPRLRSLETYIADVDPQISTVMPHLVRVWSAPLNPRRAEGEDPTWLPRLLAWSPWLCEFGGAVRISQPATLDRLWAMNSLKRLEVQLDVETLPNPAVLRLPAQLENLNLGIHLSGGSSPFTLTVESAGLRSLKLYNNKSDPATSPTSLCLTLSCPALVALDLAIGRPVAFSGPAGTALALQNLRLDCTGLDALSLLAILTQQGAHLCSLALSTFPETFRAAWPLLTESFGRLPRLASLEVAGKLPAPEVVLACPSLRRLRLSSSSSSCGDLRSLVLDCPLLEELEAPFCETLTRDTLVGRRIQTLLGLDVSIFGAPASPLAISLHCT